MSEFDKLTKSQQKAIMKLYDVMNEVARECDESDEFNDFIGGLNIFKQSIDDLTGDMICKINEGKF